MTAAMGGEAVPDRLPLKDLEKLQNEVTKELSTLAAYNLRRGIGPVGYRSLKYNQADVSEKLTIYFQESALVDQITLVPVLYKDNGNRVKAEGFPKHFRVLAGDGSSEDVLAEFQASDSSASSIAPLVINFTPTNLDKISVEATLLSKDIGKNKYSLQLSEILVFSGLKNVALRQPVETNQSNAKRDHSLLQNLTDGATPYVMDAPKGKASRSKLIKVSKSNETPTITIDLGEVHPIDQVNLHTSNTSHSIPQSVFSNRTVPRHARIIAARKSDFSDAVHLADSVQQSFYETILIHQYAFQEIHCRYVRLEILDHSPIVPEGPNKDRISYTEIEVLSRGINLAQGRSVEISDNLTATKDAVKRMTDGRNYYGHILPMRVWLEQLARRHELEHMLPQIREALQRGYERQRANFNILAWASVILGSGTLIIILSIRTLKQRAIIETRRQIGADLHDELGANLHAISLYGSLAKREYARLNPAKNESKLDQYLDEICKIGLETGKTARYTVDTLESTEPHPNLSEDLQRLSERILTDIESSFHVQDTKSLNALPSKVRTGLYLFYKESLTNIVRHAHADTAISHISSEGPEIRIDIQDNGVGLDQACVPPSLMRRARMLKSKVSAELPQDGGTRITLKIPATP